MFWCLKGVLFPLRTKGPACSFPAGQNHAAASRHTQVLLPASERRPCPCPDGSSHATCRSRGDASALWALDPVTCPLLPDHTDRHHGLPPGWRQGQSQAPPGPPQGKSGWVHSP